MTKRTFCTASKIETPFFSAKPPKPSAPRRAPATQTKPGDDPSEIFNIREYHPGDAVSRIHWKLSSKSDILFIKEFGFPIEKKILLLAEYLPESECPAIHSDMKEAQAFLTLIYSLSVRFAESENVAFLAWHDGTA